MAKGNKLSAEKEAQISKELTIEQKYQILQAVLHPRMGHVEKIYITENGKFHFTQGHTLEISRQLDPVKDAKIIEVTGKRYTKVALEGKYISRSKVVDEILVEDFVEDKEQIVKDYAEYLQSLREKKKKEIVENPDPTAELLSDALRAAGKK